MFNAKKSRGIEDVLHEKGLLNEDQLSAVKFEHVNSGKPVTEVIKERGYVTDKDFVEAFGEVYNIAFVDLKEIPIDNDVFNIVPLTTLKKYKIIPFKIEEDRLHLAMADPLDLQTIEFVERKTSNKVIPFIATTEEIERILDEFKGQAIGDEISAALEEISQTTLKIEESQADITDDNIIRDAPVARIVNMMLETAVKNGASDVHLEPGEEKSRLRYRVDGILEEKRTLPKEMHDSVTARIKILSNMKIDEKRIPQDGRFKIQVGDTFTDLRVSSLPTIYGEKIVIRLLKEQGVVFSYKDLGLRGLSLKRLEQATMKPTGMILVTGPTGSGKTVTLSAALSKLNTQRVNITTIEDPVEIRVLGVNQVQVNPQAGLTFASGLRSFLRQDPNIILVGEIRDGETAELAIHAALTGHLVLSTLHTNSAAGAIPRLLDMGVEDFLLSSTLIAILAQRLVRKICVECKTEFEPPKEIQEEIRVALTEIKANTALVSKDPIVAKALKILDESKLTLYKGQGCDACGQTGYKGRLGIFELLEMTEKIAHLTVENNPSDVLTKASIEEGMITLLQEGYLRALEGSTTLEEVMRVAM
ncbi:GspE/PulE family protein [Patescibacteria group bacterium]